MSNIQTTLFSFLTTAVLMSACTTSKSKIPGQFKQYSPPSSELHDTIAHQDSALFAAFNARNLDKLKMWFSEDLEFYHDLGGVTNYEQNMAAFKKTFTAERSVRRELIAGSMEVYPIQNYGAVETGVHRFFATEKGQKEKLGSEAKFVHVWHKTGAGWKITRVISYAHQEY